ncbi:HEAT repeat domain-containing protein [Gimesia panareensis]|uniref:HEAT repeat domain-containing protein n=1 Tax=Gimesia panareensis TaxID=2527978 RepID=UPI001189BFB6|nr:HEAT repeat domain-containing protein [Gimesia panareensis]QDU52397.1 hypothetical protein Pan110_47740 [Gimesia panareensis]
MYRCLLLGVFVLVGCQSEPPPDFSGLTMDQLRTKMSDPDPGVRWHAVFEAEHRDGQTVQVVKTLTALLQDENVEVRRVTTQALSSVLMDVKPPYPEEVQQAIQALRDNEDPDEVVQAGVRIALRVVDIKQK